MKWSAGRSCLTSHRGLTLHCCTSTTAGGLNSSARQVQTHLQMYLFLSKGRVSSVCYCCSRPLLFSNYRRTGSPRLISRLFPRRVENTARGKSGTFWQFVCFFDIRINGLNVGASSCLNTFFTPGFIFGEASLFLQHPHRSKGVDKQGNQLRLQWRFGVINSLLLFRTWANKASSTTVTNCDTVGTVRAEIGRVVVVFLLQDNVMLFPTQLQTEPLWELFTGTHTRRVVTQWQTLLFEPHSNPLLLHVWNGKSHITRFTKSADWVMKWSL